ncbi:MAG: hypothetical protein OEU54_04465 [Gemmatimonadota bacterium]|nr:hypothetical protein [Gemmatimonadota bacterium]
MSIEPRLTTRSPHSRQIGIAAFALLAFTLLPSPTRAQEEGGPERIDSPYRWREKGLRLGLWTAYHAGNRGNLDFGQGPAFATGAKFRARISSPLSFELGLTYGFADKWVVDPREEAGPVVTDTVSAGWLRADLGVQVALTGARTWHGFHPYALLGGGWVFGLNEGASEVFGEPELAVFRYEINTAPQVFLGIGTEVFASEKIGIGFEIRDYFIRQAAPEGYFLPEILNRLDESGSPAPRRSAWLMNFEFGISLWYYF